MDLLSVLSTFESLGPMIGFVALFVFLAFISRDMKHMNKEIININTKLDNHITDTNKRIDKISDRMDKISVQLNDRMDKISDQFGRLYETLLKDKQQK